MHRTQKLVVWITDKSAARRCAEIAERGERAAAAAARASVLWTNCEDAGEGASNATLAYYDAAASVCEGWCVEYAQRRTLAPDWALWSAPLAHIEAALERTQGRGQGCTPAPRVAGLRCGQGAAHLPYALAPNCWGEGWYSRPAHPKDAWGVCAGGGAVEPRPAQGAYTRGALAPWGGPCVRRVDTGRDDYRARAAVGVCVRGGALASGWRCAGGEGASAPPTVYPSAGWQG